jgi:hypothetical protein
VLGLGLFYSYLRGGRLFVRHSLERIDAVTTRRLPLPSIANFGGLLALIFGINFGLWTYRQSGDVPRSILIGYLAGIGICLLASFGLVRFQRSSLSVNSLNGNFTFDTYQAFTEVQRVQERIWQARAELLSRAVNLAMFPVVPPAPEPGPQPVPPPKKEERRSKRR